MVACEEAVAVISRWWLPGLGIFIAREEERGFDSESDEMRRPAGKEEGKN